MIGALFVAGPVVAQTGPQGAITGTVMARAGGQPVAGAIVAVDGTGRSTVAGGTGRFQILNVPAGAAVLIVKAPGFLDLRSPAVQVRAGETAELNIELEVTPNFMERVQVTATKTPLSVGDVAAQTDIIDRDTIESRGDQTLVQAIAHVPGAVVSTQLGIFESVMLRGLPRGDPEFTNTLLLIDGVPQTTSRNGSRVIGLTINDASNIEVVRGPNSALYGRTAIGGSVNVLTAAPTPKPEFNVDFTGGQQGMLKGLARVSGPIAQWGGYYASIGKERNTGYFNTKTGGDYSDGNTAVFGKLTFAPDSKGFGSVSFNHVDSDNSTPTNEPIVDGQLLHVIEPLFDRLTNFNIPGPNYHQGESRLTFNYTRQLSSWSRARRGVRLPRRAAAVHPRRRFHQHAVRSRGAHGRDVSVRSGSQGEDRLRGAPSRADAAHRRGQELADRRRIVRAHERDAGNRLSVHRRGERRHSDRLPQSGDPADVHVAA